jgi:hypothetical protein
MVWSSYRVLFPGQATGRAFDPWRYPTPHRVTFLTLVLLAFAGCGAAMTSAVSGPVAVSIGDVGHMCWTPEGWSPRGCVIRSGEKLAVYCRAGSREELAECLAHELHHVVDPTWRHPKDGR